MKDFFPANVVFQISDRADDPVNFVGHEYFDGERRANRAQFLKRRLNLRADETVVPKLNHGVRVEVVERHNPRWGDIQADAVITATKGLALTMTAADCPPVAIYDQVHGVIALIHCGWRPLAGGIIAATMAKMAEAYNVDPLNCMAYIGPGICQGDYEVGWEVAKQFGYEISPAGKMQLDLPAEITKRLLAAGLSKMNIQATPECTFHTQGDTGPKYYSWRRDKSDPLDCQMAVFLMR